MDERANELNIGFGAKLMHFLQSAQMHGICTASVSDNWPVIQHLATANDRQLNLNMTPPAQ